jgi:CHASE2 domain-containing sensor protein
MLIQRLLQILLAAIVLVAAFGVLAFVLKLAGWLLGLVVKVVIVLIVVAAVLRFFELVREKTRR